MKDFETNRLKRSGLSPTVALNAKGIEMKEKGIDILSFAAGEPDFDTPESIKEAAVQAIRNNQTHYTSAAAVPLHGNSGRKTVLIPTKTGSLLLREQSWLFFRLCLPFSKRATSVSCPHRLIRLTARLFR